MDFFSIVGFFELKMNHFMRKKSGYITQRISVCSVEKKEKIGDEFAIQPLLQLLLLLLPLL